VRVFSGIQPTGAKHLGNYSGGFRQYVATQDRAHESGGAAFFCIVDMHSITVAYDPAELRESTLSLAAILFASGLDPDRSVVFVQSHVTAHAEAAWMLSSAASMGELRRMTQFKDKSEQQEFVSVGLFTYPVLMAGDILLYQTDAVPVGEDQRQHLELARDIAERFNSRYGETFRLPDAIIPEVGGRIMDLQEPTKKMSTTGGTEQGTVFVLDAPETIQRKFKTAVTDSGRDVRRGPGKEGISNLIEILAIATGSEPDEIESRYDGQGYGQFKADVAEAVIELLAPVKRRYEELRADSAELERLLRVGAEKAAAEAAPTLARMYERMGFVRA
jgi:tryptophanyl-tRNA synthetase